MSNLNKVLLIGRVGQDAEVRYTKSGQAVANFSIATNDFWKDKQGNKQERTEWHNIVAWAGQAEFVQNYCKKGRLIYVEGRLQTRDWTDQQSVKHYKTEVISNNIQLLDRPSDAQGGGPRAGAAPPSGGGKQYADYSPADAQGSQGGQTGEPEEAYIEDDIPF